MPTVEEVLSDPVFFKMPASEQRKYVGKLDPVFSSLPDSAQEEFLIKASLKAASAAPGMPPIKAPMGYVSLYGSKPDIAAQQISPEDLAAMHQGSEKRKEDLKQWGSEHPVQNFARDLAINTLPGPSEIETGASVTSGGVKMLGQAAKKMFNDAPVKPVPLSKPIAKATDALRRAYTAYQGVVQDEAAATERAATAKSFDAMTGKPSGPKASVPVRAPVARAKTADELAFDAAPRERVASQIPDVAATPAPKARVPLRAPESTPAVAPDATPIKAPLPSGRVPGPVAAVKDAIAVAEKEAVDPPTPGRAPRESDKHFKVHAQVKKAIRASAELYAKGIKTADLDKLTPEQLKSALGKHSEETFDRIKFELRGLETGKVKPPE